MQVYAKTSGKMRDFASVKKWDSQRDHKFVVTYRQGGRRQVRYFKDEKDAKRFAKEKTNELRSEGHQHGELSYEERQAVTVARQTGVNLRAAIEHYAKHLESLGHSTTVESAIRELLAIRQAEGKSRSHLADLRHRLRLFADSYGGRIVASIPTREIDGWLTGLACAPQTRVNFRRIIHNLFAFCLGRDYCASNPVARATKVKVPPKAIGILSVSEAQALLQACPPSILPAAAIGLFGGLRASEIARLDWHSIDLDRRFIEVAASKTKTAQRRLVTISDNLHAWLAPFQAISGRVRPSTNTYRRKFKKALEAAESRAGPTMRCVTVSPRIISPIIKTLRRLRWSLATPKA